MPSVPHPSIPRWSSLARGLLGALAIIASAGVAFAGPPAAPEGHDIIIVAGQSNAYGAGAGPSHDPLDTDAIDSRMEQIGRLGADDMKLVGVERVLNGVNRDGLQHWEKPAISLATGFGLTFARHYITEVLAPNRSVVIIPAARGGSSILEWLGVTKPVYPGRPVQPLYSDMIARIHAAEALPGENRVVAFLWHQGETDALWSALPAFQRVTGMTPQVYERDLLTLIGRVRKDIPGTYPIVMGTFTPDWVPKGPSGEAMKTAVEQDIRKVAGRVKLAGVVSTTGLESNYSSGASPSPVQSIHFSAASQVELGNRYFAVWKRVEDQRPSAAH